MNATQRKGGDQSITQVTVSLAEIDALRSKVVDLKQQNSELKAKVKTLEKQLHDLTEPTKLADAKAFRSRRRLE